MKDIIHGAEGYKVGEIVCWDYGNIYVSKFSKKMNESNLL